MVPNLIARIRVEPCIMQGNALTPKSLWCQVFLIQWMGNGLSNPNFGVRKTYAVPFDGHSWIVDSWWPCLTGCASANDCLIERIIGVFPVHHEMVRVIRGIGSHPSKSGWGIALQSAVVDYWFSHAGQRNFFSVGIEWATFGCVAVVFKTRSCGLSILGIGLVYAFAIITRCSWSVISLERT